MQILEASSQFGNPNLGKDVHSMNKFLSYSISSFGIEMLLNDNAIIEYKSSKKILCMMINQHKSSLNN